jgi:hypothetical protein
MSQATNAADQNPARGTSKRQKWTGEKLEKRRKIDRDAQRAVRERTKNQISALQRMIDTLLRNQGDGKVETLARQLREKEEENDRLKNLLSAIGKMAHTAVNTDLEPGTAGDVASSTTEVDAGLMGMVESMVAAKSDDSLPFHLDINDPETNPQLSSPDERNNDFGAAPVSTSLNLFSEQQDSLMEAAELPSSNVGMSSTYFKYPPSHLQMRSDACCNTVSAAKPIWEQVDDGLAKAQALKTRPRIPNAGKDADVCIRAILQGWVSVEQQRDLDAGWQILRYIDQNIFFLFGLI